MHSKVLAWLKYHKKPLGSSGKILERYNVPLVFEPGSSWTYGPGIDYAGLLVERITGLTLEDYMKRNLWEPLGIKDMTFSLERRPDLAARMADMSFRDGSGKLHVMTEKYHADKEGRECQDCFGGAGCYASAEEYSKIVHGLLTSDQNERILSKESLREFFKPQLNEAGATGLNSLMRYESVSCSIAFVILRNTDQLG
jgi:CubicO group peptidase (beta-lactamase class C family)